MKRYVVGTLVTSRTDEGESREPKTNLSRFIIQSAETAFENAVRTFSNFRPSEDMPIFETHSSALLIEKVIDTEYFLKHYL